MARWPYRVLKDLYDSVFRVELNKNFEDIASDINDTNKRVSTILAEPNDANLEIVDARDGEISLGDKIRTFNAQLATTTTDLEQRGVNVSSFINTSASLAKAIQAGIDHSYVNDGGIVFLPYLIEIDEAVKIKSNVTLEGKGRGSIIKAKEGYTGNLIELYDDNTFKFKLKKLYIDGNERKSGYGIYLDRTNKSSFPGDLGADNMDGWFYIEDVEISNTGKDGLYIGKNCREGRYKTIQIRGCGGYGLFNEWGSDNKFYDITAWGNAKAGIFDKGSASQWVNCKAFLNNTNGDRSNGGFIIMSWATSYVNCSTQENYGHGFFIDSAKNVSFSACEANSNGVGGGDSASNPANQQLSSDESKFGYYVTNSKDVQIFGGIGEDFRRLMYGSKTQKAALYIDSLSERVTAFITERNQSTTYVNESTSSTVYAGTTYISSGTVNAKNLLGEQLTSRKGLSVDRSDGGNLMTTYGRNSIKHWEVGESAGDGKFHIDIYDYTLGTYLKTPLLIDKTGKITIGGYGGSIDLDQFTARTGISVDRSSGNSMFTAAKNGIVNWQFGRNANDDSFQIDQYDPTNGTYLRTPLYFLNDGSVKLGISGKAMSFYGKTPITQPIVTGSKGGNEALTSLIKALSDLGLIYNSTT